MGSIYLALKYDVKSLGLTASSFAQDYSKRDPVGTPSPLDPKIAKDFLLFYKTGRRGRIGAGDVVTDSSAETVWKSFMTAWQRKTGEHFPKPLRDTILNVEDPFGLSYDTGADACDS